MVQVLSRAQEFGEAIQVSAFAASESSKVAAQFKVQSVSVWYDSDLLKVAAAIDWLHASGCQVLVKRHGDRPGAANPYRMAYYHKPWFYADFANRVRDGLRGHLLPGDAIEVANEPAYTAGDGLLYSDNLPVWNDLFAGIAWDDHAAFPGVEVIGPLPGGMQPEVVTDMLAGVNLSPASFAAFDSISGHLYPNNLPVAPRIAQFAAVGAWAHKPVRITECGADGRLGTAGVMAWISAVNAAAVLNGIVSVDWWASVAPFDGFSLDLLNNPLFASAIVSGVLHP